MPWRSSGSQSRAAIWFATTLVLVLGAGVTAFMVIALGESRESAMLFWAACFAGIVLVIIVLNIRWEEPVNQLKFWISFRERKDPADEYVAARRSIERREKYGKNQPPTIESVRDAADHAGAWAPRSNVDRQRPKKS